VFSAAWFQSFLPSWLAAFSVGRACVHLPPRQPAERPPRHGLLSSLQVGRAEWLHPNDRLDGLGLLLMGRVDTFGGCTAGESHKKAESHQGGSSDERCASKRSASLRALQVQSNGRRALVLPGTGGRAQRQARVKVAAQSTGMPSSRRRCCGSDLHHARAPGAIRWPGAEMGEDAGQARHAQGVPTVSSRRGTHDAEEGKWRLFGAAADCRCVHPDQPGPESQAALGSSGRTGLSDHSQERGRSGGFRRWRAGAGVARSRSLPCPALVQAARDEAGQVIRPSAEGDAAEQGGVEAGRRPGQQLERRVG